MCHESRILFGCGLTNFVSQEIGLGAIVNTNQIQVAEHTVACLAAGRHWGMTNLRLGSIRLKENIPSRRLGAEAHLLVAL